jgi:chromosomal replication initiation ATPase DnaA
MNYEIELKNTLTSVNIDYSDAELSELYLLLNSIYLVFGVNLFELKSNSRRKHISYARRVFFVYVHKILPYITYNKVGEILNKNCSTAFESINVFLNDNLKFNNEFNDYFERIKLLMTY